MEVNALFNTKLNFIIAFISCILVPACITSSSRAKLFQLYPQFIDKQPGETPLKSASHHDVLSCAIFCYHEKACSNFFFTANQHMCSLYGGDLNSSSFLQSSGMMGYAKQKPGDCCDVMNDGETTNGFYNIYPRDNGSPIRVFCEVESDDAGWLVIQRRMDGSVDFYNTWTQYRDGFGDNNEMWLGNNNLHRLSSQGQLEMRIDLETFDGNTAYALYKNFYVASEQNYFRLTLGEYSGNAGNSFVTNNGCNFTTKDRDLDEWNGVNCGEQNKGGWWYYNCGTTNLNGLYYHNDTKLVYDGVFWNLFVLNRSLKRTVMKIRPMK